MDLGKWLINEMPVEERLQTELEARKEDPRTAMLYRLCVQQQYQLKQAVSEIARLEMMLMQRDR